MRVVESSEAGRWRPGLILIALGAIILELAHVQEAAPAILDDFAEATGARLYRKAVSQLGSDALARFTDAAHL